MKNVEQDVRLYNEKTYVRDKIIVLGASVVLLMIHFGAIIPDLNKLVKGFKIVNQSIMIGFLYLVWFYLYFSFYQKYWSSVKRELKKIKETTFRVKFAFKILHETHERSRHDFYGYNIEGLIFTPVMRFHIFYSPVTLIEEGIEKEHGSRNWIIDLKRKGRRKYILRYLVEVYLKSPIVTSYFIPFAFPVFAGIICMLVDGPGSLKTIYEELLKNIN